MYYDDAHHLGRLILKLANTIIKNRNRHLDAIGLTASQADSLQFFLTKPHSTITDLKNHLEITHQTARGLVHRMEEKQLIVIAPSLSDGRCHRIIPTENAIKLGEKMKQNRERTVLKLLSGMTAEEQETFYRLLTIAYDNIKNEEKEMLP